MLACHPLLKIFALSAFVATSINTFAGELRVASKYGDILVDDNAKRIVTLSEDALDSAIALGIHPVGAIATRGGESVAEYIQDRVGKITIVGTARQSNLEAIAAQQPDLILASASLPSDQYTILSKIAPTLVPVSPGMLSGSWKTIARSYAKALNKSAEMDEILEAVTKHENEVKAMISASLPNDQQTATLARWMPQGPLVMSTQIFSSDILSASGFTLDDAGVVKSGRPHSSPLSLENLAKIDSDWLFLATLNTEGKDALEAAKSSPAFSRLDVVKNDRVITVNGQLWTSAAGPLAAHQILNDIKNNVSQKLKSSK